MGAMRPTSEYCFQANYSWAITLYYRRETRLLKNAPMLGKENCYKYFRISLKMSSFTSNNTL